MATVVVRFAAFLVGAKLDVVPRLAGEFTPAPAACSTKVRKDSSVVVEGLAAGRYWLTDGESHIAVTAKDGVMVPAVVQPSKTTLPAGEPDGTVVTGARSTANTRVRRAKAPAKKSAAK